MKRSNIHIINGSDETEENASRHCKNSPIDAASAEMKKKLLEFVAINAATSDLCEMHARLIELSGALSRVEGKSASAWAGC